MTVNRYYNRNNRQYTTNQQIALAMELKQMGKHIRPLLLVINHSLHSFQSLTYILASLVNVFTRSATVLRSDSASPKPG